MSDIWTPEIEVSPELAKALISSQFPPFANATIERFGTGWDNVAYLVDKQIVFRFPQRAVAAPLIEREIVYLPLIAPHLDISTTSPRYEGKPTADYPWSFAGYARLAGATACSQTISLDERAALAEDLANFLRALHAIDATHFSPPLPPDAIGKLDPQRLGVDEEPPSGPHCVVHGDLYARHLILGDDHRLTGVIDWGDVHYGNPAVDLSVVHMMIPARFHGRFLDIYGEVDEKTWRFARYRARQHAGLCQDYATKQGDSALLQAAHVALRYIDEQ